MSNLSIKDKLDLLTIRSRLKDYSTADVVEQRNKLVELWRAAHPEAAKEQSTYMHPLMRIEHRRTESETRNDITQKQPDEVWSNDVYYVSVRRWKDDRVFGTGEGMIQLGIATHDGTARHDWREFQAIKNQLAGPECEGFELFPAESRLIDPSNYYTLWCFPGLKRLKVGIVDREVRDADVALAPQRALAKYQIGVDPAAPGTDETVEVEWPFE